MIRCHGPTSSGGTTTLPPHPVGATRHAPTPPAREELEQLGDEIAALAADLHAGTYRLLVRLRDFDQHDGWSAGFLSCAHWLSWRTGIARGAAREQVRVARALGALPRLASAMERGELSYSKVRALTRVATPETEGELLELARHATAAQVETIVRAWRRVDRVAEAESERRRHEGRHLTLRVDDDGSYIIRGRLEPEVGALFERALEEASRALYDVHEQSPPATATPTPGPERPAPAQRRADALGLLAELALENHETEMEAAAPATGSNASGAASPTTGMNTPDTVSPGPPRASTAARGARTLLRRRARRVQVVVHVDADALLAGADSGQSVLAGGVRVSAETSRRLACDASRVIMTHDVAGTVLDVGRRTRTVPTPIRRALEHRDFACRFPACTNRLADAHHVRHWADGGPTRLDNLVLLCPRHHRAVHEEGYRVTPIAGGGFAFLYPDGRRILDAPPMPIRAPRRREASDSGASAGAACPPYERLDLDWTLRTLYRPRQSSPPCRVESVASEERPAV